MSLLVSEAFAVPSPLFGWGGSSDFLSIAHFSPPSQVTAALARLLTRTASGPWRFRLDDFETSPPTPISSTFTFLNPISTGHTLQTVFRPPAGTTFAEEDFDAQRSCCGAGFWVLLW